MKKYILSLIAVVALSTSVSALNLDLNINRLDTGGYGSVGISDTAWATSLGFVNHKIEVGTTETTVTAIVLQVNGISSLASNLDLTYGVQYAMNKVERKDGSTTTETDDNDTGIFVGLKTDLTDSLSLTANYFIYNADDADDKETGIGNKTQLVATYSLPL